MEPDNERRIRHEDWRNKSLLSVECFIRHKYSHERRTQEFFRANDVNPLSTIDVTDASTQARNLARLLDHVGLPTNPTMAVSHRNRAKSDSGLSPEVLALIDRSTAACETKGPGSS